MRAFAARRIHGKVETGRRAESLLDIMQPGTVIAVFRSESEARRSRLAFGREYDGTSPLIRGAAAGTELATRWRERPSLRSLLGLSDEVMVVEQLARHLEFGDSLLAPRTEERRARPGLEIAERVFAIGPWTFRVLH